MTSSATDDLRVLRAIDRLEVGPVVVCRYEQDVFVPGGPVDENLAALVVAQVALNYGLFCDEIVLHGPLTPIDTAMMVLVETGESGDAEINAMTEAEGDVHAGEIETSLALHDRPHLVRMDRAKPEVLQFASPYLSFTGPHAVAWHARTARISATGTLGDPTKATAEKGKKIWEITVRHLVALIEDLKAMTLSELYRSGRHQPGSD